MASLEAFEELVAANTRAPGNANRIRRLKEMHAELTAQGHSVELPVFKQKQATTATLTALAAEKAKLEADIEKLQGVKSAVVESEQRPLQPEPPVAKAADARPAGVEGSLLHARFDVESITTICASDLSHRLVLPMLFAGYQTMMFDPQNDVSQ